MNLKLGDLHMPFQFEYLEDALEFIKLANSQTELEEVINLYQTLEAGELECHDTAQEEMFKYPKLSFGVKSQVVCFN